MPFLIRALILWLILLGICVLIPTLLPHSHFEEADPFLAIPGVFSLPAAVVATWWASLRLPRHPGGRVIFWAITWWLWLLVFVLLTGGMQRAEVSWTLPPLGFVLIALVAAPFVAQFLFFRGGIPPRLRSWYWVSMGLVWALVMLIVSLQLPLPEALSSFDLPATPQVLLLSLQLAGVVLLGLHWQTGRWPTRQIFREAFAGLAFVPLILAVAGVEGRLYRQIQVRRALAAWAQADAPLAQGGETFLASETNQTAEQVLLSCRHWWQAAYDGYPEKGILASTKGDREDRTPYSWPLADDFPLGVRGFGSHAAAFRAFAETLLQEKPPVFGWSPFRDRLSLDDFMTRDVMARLAAVHAATCLAAGDEAGARQSIAAARRIYQAIPDADGWPDDIGLIRHLQGLIPLILVEARFSATDDAPAAIARDLADWLHRLRQVARYHAWRALSLPRTDLYAEESPFSVLPPWIGREVFAWNLRVEGARSARALAAPLEHRLLLGEEDRFIHTWRMIHVVSLKREQAHLIRTARARLAQGLPMEDHPSAVFPSGRWQLQFDPGNYAVRFQLIGAPLWSPVQLDDVDFQFTWQYRRPAAPR